MTENDKKNSNSKTLSLRGTGGSVRMNLSHGRSKSVLIETKRKKIILPNKNKLSKTENEIDITKENNKKAFSEEQINRRKKAIEAAREREIQIKEEQEKLKNKIILDNKTEDNQQNDNKKVDEIVDTIPEIKKANKGIQNK